MEYCAPSMVGEKLQIATYVDPATFMKIESMRGDVSHSKFVGKLLQKIIEQ